MAIAVWPTIIAGNFLQAFYILKGGAREAGLIVTVVLILVYAQMIFEYNKFTKKGGVAPPPLPQSVKRRLYTLWSVIAVVEAVEVYGVLAHFLTLDVTLALAALQAVVAVLYTWWVTRSKK